MPETSGITAETAFVGERLKAQSNRKVINCRTIEETFDNIDIAEIFLTKDTHS